MTAGAPASASDVWGSASDNVFVVGIGGIHHYNGVAWSHVPSGMPTEPVLNAIWGNSANDVFAVGEAGVILHYDGSTWGQMTTGTYHAFYGVGGSSSDDVFAVGFMGLLYHFDGVMWSPIASGTTQHLYDVWASSPTDVFVVGGVALHYDGNEWSQMGLPGGRGIWGASPTDVYATYGGRVMHYDGTGWTASSFWVSQTLRGVFGLSECDVFAVGGAGVILHFGDTSTVPVFISHFGASAVERAIELTWEVASDENISGFRVYRSDNRDPAERRIDNGELIASSLRRYLDTAILPGVRYRYTLGVVDWTGGEWRSPTIEIEAALAALELSQNYPNPFNPATRIRFCLPKKANVTLQVFNADGKLVTTLMNGVREPGPQEIEWDGRNGHGQPVSSGVYFCRLEVGGRQLSRKMILLK